VPAIAAETAAPRSRETLDRRVTLPDMAAVITDRRHRDQTLSSAAKATDK
jgi:hypothetical protein